MPSKSPTSIVRNPTSNSPLLRSLNQAFAQTVAKIGNSPGFLTLVGTLPPPRVRLTVPQEWPTANIWQCDSNDLAGQKLEVVGGAIREYPAILQTARTVGQRKLQPHRTIRSHWRVAAPKLWIRGGHAVAVCSNLNRGIEPKRPEFGDFSTRPAHFGKGLTRQIFLA